jgi:hypothetical protein
MEFSGIEWDAPGILWSSVWTMVREIYIKGSIERE